MTLKGQILLSVLVVIAAAGGWYFFVQKSEPTGGGAGTATVAAGGTQPQSRAGRPGGNVTVVTQPVVFEAVTEDLHAVGTAAAVRAVTLFPQVSGIATEVAVRAGEEVEADAVLYRFEDQTQAVAVERARIAADDAKAALARAEQLAQSRNIAAVTLADTRSRAAAADIDLRTAELELARRTVKAPFAGVVGLPGPSVGEMVATTTALVTLDDLSAFTVAFEAPERFASLLKSGHAVSATSAGLPGKVIGGTVSAVDSRVDVATRTFRVEARLDRGIEGLKPGMSVVVRLSFPQEPRAAVPSLAIQWDRAGSFVWTVSNNQAKRTPVQILNRRSGVVFVAGELDDGDEIVVEGLQRLRDGMTVVRSSDSGTGRPSSSGRMEAGG